MASSSSVSASAAAARRRTPPPTFTQAQRDAQARGKQWEDPEDVLDAQRFVDRKNVARALEVLESAELLMWFAQSMDQSLAATRQHFQNIALGLEPQAPDAWRDEGEVPPEQRVNSTASGAASPANGRSRGKARERSGNEKERERGKKRNWGARDRSGEGSSRGE